MPNIGLPNGDTRAVRGSLVGYVHSVMVSFQSQKHAIVQFKKAANLVEKYIKIPFIYSVYVFSWFHSI
jgi:hypothetical protein